MIRQMIISLQNNNNNNNNNRHKTHLLTNTPINIDTSNMQLVRQTLKIRNQYIQ